MNLMPTPSRNEVSAASGRPRAKGWSRTALETDFPATLVSAAAEKEAWRKEVHRPATHTHKWWAQRLGTVFRGIITASLVETRDQAAAAFTSRTEHEGVVVLDPFAGSGTTLVEAVKLGCRVVGYDINPVATLVQRQALATWDRRALQKAFNDVQGRVREQIDALHRNSRGETVLYYFWVATAACPECPADEARVELFSTYVFAQHAYVKKYPTAQATCPGCHSVVTVNLATEDGFACSCGWSGGFDGPVKGQTMTCRHGHTSKVLAALGGQPPEHQMYAKLVLTGQGKKRYEPIDDFDLDLYETATKTLVDHELELVLPEGRLDPGYNTRQAMAWGYTTWRQFFNDRQLLSLGLLGAAVRDLEPSPEREALVALFSGILEFNNLFCSYKGEGTGAVRHMFSHHVLKPERTPLEAHPWGTPASSGAFSTLFKSRLLRALEYKVKPHDLVGTARVFGLSRPLAVPIVETGCAADPTSAMVATGSSAHMDLADGSVDLVITDPPYFDNVHYSELADFFHAWLRRLSPFEGYPTSLESTRLDGEVQSSDAQGFSDAISAVWAECNRVLRSDGLLAFTFHQARPEGWKALIEALHQAMFIVTAVQPVKGEMSVAAPKSGAADPSNLDSIVVCRKTDNGLRPTIADSVARLRALTCSGVTVGWSDVQSVVRGTVLAEFTSPGNTKLLSDLLAEAAGSADEACHALGLKSKR